jgi:molybdopterin-guanine dinucleotide biosynthesis protein MobB
MPPVICIVGRSQSGKTTLIENLIPVLIRRGHRIGTVKHTHHIFDFDIAGKDSRRHKDAGAHTVVIAAPGRVALIKDDRQGTLESVLAYFEDVDLVITEGYKNEPRPKIEVVRAARHPESLLKGDSHLIAVVSDADISPGVPKFALDDVEKLADFIEEKYLK